MAGQFETGTSGQTRLLNFKISVGTASRRVYTHTHIHVAYKLGYI
jgi:hypothetical protein